MAVHLDIRPRLTFPAEPRAARRRRWRLPPMVLPALGYWLAMAALTYGFTRLGPNPLDDAPTAAELNGEQPAGTPRRPSPAAPAPAPEQAAPAEPALVPTATAPLSAEATPSDLADTEPEPRRPPEPQNGTRTDTLASRRAVATEPEAPPPQAEAAPPQLTFPEFTDSSRPRPREHAADGPRLDSLFERAAETLPPPAGKTPPPVERNPDAAPGSSSCEAAIARNNEQMTIGAARGAPDISREAYASILQDGRYLAGCALPERAVVEICAAVQDGHAVGITVVTRPMSSQLNACVRNAVARLKFPTNARLDVTHTRFDAVRH